MLEKVIEERVRGIFYGAPSEFFLKDKAKLKFGDHFSTNCAEAVNKFVELCARRNVLIHNDGRVDRKYLREAPGSKFKLRETVSVHEPYLRGALLTLRGLCATTGVLVCERASTRIRCPRAECSSDTRLSNHSASEHPPDQSCETASGK